MNSIMCCLTGALDEAGRFLAGVQNESWAVPAGDVDWSCHHTAGHIADDLFSYASQVIAQPKDDYLPIEAVLDAAAPKQRAVEAIMMCGRLLIYAVDAAAPTGRSWHPYGTSNPAGFAAMGVVEILVHTYDIARCLKRDWMPPADLCKPVLHRLFPGAPAGNADEVLLYCCGRRPLEDMPRLTHWSWDSAVRS